MNGTIFEEREYRLVTWTPARPVVAEISRPRTARPMRGRFPRSHSRSRVRALIGVLALLIALGLDLTTAYAQADAVCNNMPGSGERILCTEARTSTTDIDIDAQRVDVDTTTAAEHGIYGEHNGTGDIIIKAEQGVDIETSGENSYGIFGYHKGTGDVTLKVKGVSGADTITTNGGSTSYAINGRNYGLGGLDITVSDVNITTTGSDMNIQGRTPRGVSGKLFPSFATAPPLILIPEFSFPTYNGVYDVNINVSGSRISTMAHMAYGIFGAHEGIDGTAVLNGKVNITATNTNITTMGEYAAGIYGRRHFSYGDIMLNMTGGSIITEGAEGPAVYLYGESQQSGDLIAKVTDADLRTKGSYLAQGIYALHGPGRHSLTGDIRIDAHNVNITTEGTGIYSGVGTLSHGIYGYHNGTGAIDIDARGGSINTAGAYSYGIYGIHNRIGTVMIDTHDGHRITTIGRYGHGIMAYHYNTTDNTSSMAITVGGSVDARGEFARGSGWAPSM